MARKRFILDQIIGMLEEAEVRLSQGEVKLTTSRPSGMILVPLEGIRKT